MIQRLLMMMRAGRLFATLAAFLALLAPSQARAAAFTITDGASDIITVATCDFEGGITVNGVGMGSCGVGSGGTISFAETSTPFTWSGIWIDNGSTTPSTRTIYFVEQGTTNVISDILTLTFARTTISNRAQFSGSFQSDTDSGPSLGTVPVGTPAANIWLEAAGAFTFAAPFLSGSVSSDLDPIPEPATLGLLGVGLLGLGVSGQRRRKAAGILR